MKPVNRRDLLQSKSFDGQTKPQEKIIVHKPKQPEANVRKTKGGYPKKSAAKHPRKHLFGQKRFTNRQRKNLFKAQHSGQLKQNQRKPKNRHHRNKSLAAIPHAYKVAGAGVGAIAVIGVSYAAIANHHNQQSTNEGNDDANTSTPSLNFASSHHKAHHVTGKHHGKSKSDNLDNLIGSTASGKSSDNKNNLLDDLTGGANGGGVSGSKLKNLLADAGVSKAHADALGNNDHPQSSHSVPSPIPNTNNNTGNGKMTLAASSIPSSSAVHPVNLATSNLQHPATPAHATTSVKTPTAGPVAPVVQNKPVPMTSGTVTKPMTGGNTTGGTTAPIHAGSPTTPAQPSSEATTNPGSSTVGGGTGTPSSGATTTSSGTSNPSSGVGNQGSTGPTQPASSANVQTSATVPVNQPVNIANNVSVTDSNGQVVTGNVNDTGITMQNQGKYQINAQVNGQGGQNLTISTKVNVTADGNSVNTVNQDPIKNFVAAPVTVKVNQSVPLLDNCTIQAANGSSVTNQTETAGVRFDHPGDYQIKYVIGNTLVTREVHVTQ